MDQKEKNQDFSLDDILKEFSDTKPAEETLPKLEDELPEVEEVPEEFPALDLSDTVAFTPVDTGEVPDLSSQTIRLDTDEILSEAAQAVMDDDTVSFTPVGQGEAGSVISIDPVPIPENAEPFSAGWEPQYEEPIGEYVPPEPIVFRPRSRLRELKRQLVAGPERRYYALAEEGVGRLQISIFLSFLVVVLSVASIGLYQMGMVQENRMRLLVFGEFFAMLFSALLGSERLMEGIIAPFKGRFSLDTMLVLTFIICIADGVFCLQQVRVPYCAAFCLEMTMALWAEYQRRNTEMAQMDTLRKAVRLNRVALARDCCKGRPGVYVADGEVDDFMEVYNRTPAPEKAVNLYALLVFLASGAIAVFVGLNKGLSDALQIWSAAVLAAMPVSIFVSQSRPAAIVERRLHRAGAVLCGWQGTKALKGKIAVPLTDSDLFPSGTMKINGVKFYSQRDTDQTIAYTAALMTVAQTGLAPIFEQLLDSRNGLHYAVENYRVYSVGGIGGEVRGESVLVGTQPFLQEMGVELPEGARVNQAVYAAIDGELCGVFALSFGKLKGVSAGLSALCGCRKVMPILHSDNFLLNESFIRAKFGVRTRRFFFPNYEERVPVTAWRENPGESIPCALTTQDSLAAPAFAITGAKALRGASIAGAVIHMLGGIVGLLAVAALILVDAGHLLTPTNLLLFELIWTVPGLLVTEWARNS